MTPRMLSRVGFGALALTLAMSLALIACAQAPAPATAPSKAESPKSTSPSEQAKPAETKPAPAPATKPATEAKPAPAPDAKPATAAKPAATPQYGGILKILSGWPPTTFGYPASPGGGNRPMALPAVENLVGMDIQGRTTPRLATAWEVGKDGKSITFTLRKGVKFHDGTDFNARAAKWNLEQYLKGEWDGTGNWSSIDVVDDYTVRINLSEYDNGILSLIAITIGMMISPSAVEKNGEEWAQTHPVGTGPFKLVGYERDVFLKYERFDGYWGDKPYLDGIEFRFVKDPMVQSAGLQAGEGHMIYRASANTAADLQKKGYQVIASGYGAMPTHLDVLAPDTVYPDSIFADKRVREALDYAIDKKAIAKAVGLGFWEATQQIAPSQYVGYDPGLEGRSYNPEKAKQLLAAAGRPNGFKTRIIAPNTAEKDMLVAIQSNLKAIGIDVQLEIVPRAKYNEYDLKGWKDGLAWFEVALQPNLTNSLSKFLGAPATRYVSLNRPSAWVDLLNRVRATADFGAYEALTAQAVRFAYDEAMVVPLFALAQPYIIGPKAHDTGFLTTGHQTDWTPQKAWLAK